MTAFWDQAVDVLREAILAFGYACNGNLGAGILAVTFLARLALMPIALRLARMTAAHQRIVRKIQPELDAIKTRYASNARRVHEETLKVFSREGISPVPVGGLLGTLAQAPVFLALYAAVRRVALMGGRFGWIRDISQPSLMLTLIVGAVTALGTMAGADSSTPNRHLLMLLPTIITIIVLSKMTAGVALSWGMSSAFSAAQVAITKRQSAA